MSIEPPTILDGARVVSYAVVDDSVVYVEGNTLYVDGELLGPVPRLAIGQDPGANRHLLFHCDSRWRVLGVAEYESAEQAKSKAELSYPGIGSRWSQHRITDTDVEDFLQRELANRTCSFCERKADQIEQAIDGSRASICNHCVSELHRNLRKD